MKRITKIENETRKIRKTRVAAYCRVSTDSDEQLVSLEAQKEHYQSLIKSRSDWAYAGLYYDEGITGTKKDKRPALMRMIVDCEDGKIDFIITKSISRFARNTTDCLELVRKLSALDIYIYFERENLNTKDMEGELMLTILSSLAEEESVSISKNAKWSIQKRFENGTFKIGYPPFGYENKNGAMEIIPEQAKIVKEIFSSFLRGDSTHVIAKNLNDRGICSKRGGQWTAGTINGILKNEKYTGDVIFQKTWTDDKFTRHMNCGEMDQYYLRDHHEAIIAREEYEAAQRLIDQHLSEKGGARGEGKYQKRYALSGKIICGECGTTLKRKIYKRLDGTHVLWACSKHIEDKRSCSQKAIRQLTIEMAFITMMNKLIFAHKQMLIPLREGLMASENKSGLGEINRLQEEMENNTSRRDRLRMMMTQGLLDAEIFNEENNTLLAEYEEMEMRLDDTKANVNEDLIHLKELERLMRFTSTASMLVDFREDLLSEYVDHLIAYSQTKIGFALKCGITLVEEVEE